MIKSTKRDHTRCPAAHYTPPPAVPFLLGSIAPCKSFKMSHQPLSNSKYSRRTNHATKSNYLMGRFFINYTTPTRCPAAQ
eukprot:scaffold24182_cov67-Skeletonema_dohrnii-CCMP3373.AAC.1